MIMKVIVVHCLVTEMITPVLCVKVNGFALINLSTVTSVQSAIFWTVAPNAFRVIYSSCPPCISLFVEPTALPFLQLFPWPLLYALYILLCVEPTAPPFLELFLWPLLYALAPKDLWGLSYLAVRGYLLQRLNSFLTARIAHTV